jgi:Uma2 family endonuclease
MPQRLSRTEFHCWAEAQSGRRFERAHGEVISMAPERWVHARLKARIWRALDREIVAGALPCQAAPDGMTFEIDDDTDYEPDALVNCGTPIADDATVAPNPVVLIEVLSPGTAAIDAGGKLADYFRLSSVQHYLLVRTTRREVIHHRRAGQTIETMVRSEGTLVLDPPGIAFHIAEIYDP